MLIPYKQRTINFQKKVKIYRKLYKNPFIVEYSVVQNNLVVAHGIDFCLKKVTQHINNNGQARTRRERVRNVHAYLVGYLFDGETIFNNPKLITYNPFRDDTFLIDGDNFISSDMVQFTKQGVFSI